MDWNFLIKPNNNLSDKLLICTDTRNLTEGCVFFALHGNNFDGNNFANEAIKQGAKFVVIDNPVVHKALPPSQSILVENTLQALQNLAQTWREILQIPVIAITGTNGKTTTKELIASVLSTQYKIFFTPGNLNNQIGVPLSLLQLTKEHQYAIIEMGASHPGDIKELAEIAKPNYGLITNIGLAHLDHLHSIEGVMQTKAELYDYIYQHNGILFRNLDNNFLSQMDKTAHDKFPFSLTQTIGYHTGSMPQNTKLVGDYNSENISAARCIGNYFNITPNNISSGIASYQPTNFRSQEKYTLCNHLVIDTYNANPTSMQHAIECFKGNTFILGEMSELGNYSHTAHQNIVNMLLEKKYKEVYLIGPKWQTTTSPYLCFENKFAFQSFLLANPFKNKYVLIKGSRSNHLEDIISLL